MNRRRVVLRTFWSLVVFLLFAPPGASAGQDSTSAVSYHDGELALAFDGTPREAALAAIREKTGHEIILPATVAANSLTLQMGPRPLDAALRHFIRTLGLESFALVFDGNGPSRQVVVLDPRTQYPAHVYSMPQYIPSTSEPIYIPPVDGPRYSAQTSATQIVSSDE
jgi:hypothetical protein